ncbi:4-amino-4-deoxy-L-arabinose transferase [Aquisphaera giovannonii]|uniref:4-amino-4-deoxy-L-arabinose transferase n=1 Tax=Aquisphaera giovannonii TaxID=406548 RepID=UPI0011E031BB|nr:4-amino-4-deoxy-L-arabinose transferase [Aquisphaera giovannonii]
MAVVAGVSALVFASEIRDEPFVDEYAYITQSYQPDALYAGMGNEAAWLDFLSFDLVPLPKYLINAAFRVTGTPRPGPYDAASWYRNTSSRWGTTRDLMIARLPFACCAVLGCAAICGLAGLTAGPRVMVLAGFALAMNPLFRLHAHRAMSEAPCEAFLILALLLGLMGWTRWWSSRGLAPAALPLWFASGCCAGLSMLAKFNGLLALFTMASWGVLGLATARGASFARRASLVAGVGLAIVSAAGTFVLLNPFMTAHPVGTPEPMRSLAEMGAISRFRFLIDQRRESSASQQRMFAHNALLGPLERAKVVAVQGLGRFGLLGPPKSDSTLRYDVQDLGALLWMPLVLLGLVRAILLGRRQRIAGEPPTAWALVLWAAVSAAVVTLYIPMAWDRYLLPIQAPFAVLAAIPLREALGRLLLQPAES